MNDRRALFGIALLALLPFLEPLATNQILTFRDHSDYFVPLRQFTASILKTGTIPFWNPYSASGEPWFANPQTGVFYPPSWILLVMPFSRGYILFLAFHTALLGTGMYLLLRRWTTQPLALFGAVAAMFCGPTISLLDINNNLASLSWLPIALWCGLKRGDDHAQAPLAALVACLTMMFLCGEPSFAFFGAVACTGVVAFSSNRPFRDLLLLPIGVIAVSAFQLFPFLHWLAGSERLAGLDPELAFASSIAPLEWISIALSPGMTRNPGTLVHSQYFIPSIYLGAPVSIGLIAAFIGLPEALRSRGRRVIFVTTGVIFATVVIAAGRFIPAVMDLLVQLHLNVNRHPSRVAPIGALAIILLAMIGLSMIPRMRLFARLSCLGISVAFTAAAFVLYRPNKTFSSAMIEPALFYVLTFLVILFRPGWLESKRLIGFGALLLAFDLINGSRALLSTDELTDSVAPYQSIANTQQKVVRIPPPAGAGNGLPEDRRHFLSGYLNLLDRIFDASTAAPVVPARHLDLERLVVSEARTDILDFLSIGWLLTERKLPATQLVPIARFGRVIVYKNRTTMPMVTLWRDFTGVTTEEEAFDLIQRGGVDLRRQMILESAPATLRAELERSRTRPLRASLRWSFEPNRVRVFIDTNESVVLVLNQTHAAGWELRLDDRRVESLRANAMFRGVFVPAGRHEIVWSYEPPFFRAGVLLSLVGMAWMILDWRSSRRPRVSTANQVQ